LQNTDFPFDDNDYEVTYIKAVRVNESYDSIRFYSSTLGNAEPATSRDRLEKSVGDLSKLLLVAEPLDYPYEFVLNYNRLNRDGEPTVWCIAGGDDEDLEGRQVANSFAEFLAGQYVGEDEPSVDLSEAASYLLIAEGGYEGRYAGVHEEGSITLEGLPVKVHWKVCSDRSRLIVFQEIDWAGQVTISREEIRKSALVFDFPALESYGVEIEPELAEMIRPAIEIELLSKFEADLIPDCYELLLHVQPGQRNRVSVTQASPFLCRWKNRKSKIVYSSIKSANAVELASVLRAVAGSCCAREDNRNDLNDED